MNKLFAHLKTVRTHRKWVRKWCFKMGIPIQGLLHDLSKYSPIELSQYKYYNGKRSPHDNMRDELGYSNSWYHHRNKNKHHDDYWIDSITRETAVKMPYKYVIEMLCDMCGASQAYNPGAWKPEKMLEYYNKRFYGETPEVHIINKDTKELFEQLLGKLSELNDMKLFIKWYKQNKKELKRNYNVR